ncbi:hypothetical protein RND81_07G089000 [Saponaria officinalis]|uniref:PB1-like domain-containing protein n=1 Tax=Saponaria officinalis TaxID=3572 RepID=A0AAW1JLH5_SAPOF
MGEAFTIVLQLHVNGGFKYAYLKTSYVGDSLVNVSGIWSNQFSFGALKEIVKRVVGESKIFFVWYKKGRKNLTFGRTIIKNDVDVAEALKTRDEQNGLDLYVSSTTPSWARVTRSAA